AAADSASAPAWVEGTSSGASSGAVGCTVSSVTKVTNFLRRSSAVSGRSAAEDPQREPPEAQVDETHVGHDHQHEDDDDDEEREQLGPGRSDDLLQLGDHLTDEQRDPGEETALLG